MSYSSFLSKAMSSTYTIEFHNGVRAEAEFLDAILPDPTCGQVDTGVMVTLASEDDEPQAHLEYFISYTDGSVWQGSYQIEGARCPEVCVIAAVRDAKETFVYDEEMRPL